MTFNLWEASSSLCAFTWGHHLKTSLWGCKDCNEMKGNSLMECQNVRDKWKDGLTRKREIVLQLCSAFISVGKSCTCMNVFLFHPFCYLFPLISFSWIRSNCFSCSFILNDPWDQGVNEKNVLLISSGLCNVFHKKRYLQRRRRLRKRRKMRNATQQR